jgi:hypothetical protein
MSDLDTRQYRNPYEAVRLPVPATPQTVVTGAPDPVHVPPTTCCVGPKACRSPFKMWQARYKACPSTFHSYENDGSGTVPVNLPDARYWVGDLNPLMYGRGQISGAQWNPYQHMNRTQMAAQFSVATLVPASDPYTRPIEAPSDTYHEYTRKYGHPQYVTF